MTKTQKVTQQWVRSAFGEADIAVKANVVCKEQGWGTVQDALSIAGSQLCLNGVVYNRGLGTHAQSEILVELPGAGARFQAFAGVDDNTLTRSGTSPAQIVFTVELDGRIVWSSDPMTCSDASAEIDIDLAGYSRFVLKAREIHDCINLAHADWADARVTLTDGTRVWLSNSYGEHRTPNSAPISFQYGGKPSSELLEAWNKTYESRAVDEDVTLHTCAYRDEETGLVCTLEMKEYASFPAVEWVVRFKNTGSAVTPVLNDVHALDMVWDSFGKEIVLHRSQGSFAQIDDFLYTQDVLFRNETCAQSKNLRVTPSRGRSSIDWLPFFNVQTEDDGLIMAIGWSGEWAAEFADASAEGVKLRAGMEKTHLKLMPGEEIRTPSILLLFWQGEPLDGNNLLRRFILKHKTPQQGGQPAAGPRCIGTWGGMKTDAHLALIAKCKERRLDFDCYWVDAGWYGVNEIDCPDLFSGDWASEIGTWMVNRHRHPEGLRPIADAAHSAGMTFMLWFEPERAMPGTQLVREHPDWFFGDVNGKSNLLLNLGHPDALRWAIDMVSAYITDLGLDWYRQDFNMDPLASWRTADAPDRQGISEIRHVEGLYAFWDELRRRHPQLMIDNCSSGGRRIDIETISRSICLWRSDYQCFPFAKADAGQIHFGGLSYWLPSHGGQALLNSLGDTYAYRSAMSSAFVDQQLLTEADNHIDESLWPWYRGQLDEVRRLQPFYYGDYYPLTPASSSPEMWMAYQMHRPDTGSGFLMAFRRQKSPFRDAIFMLRGLNTETEYLLEDADSGETWRMRGLELTDTGVSVSIGHTRESRLITYRAVSA